MQADNFIAGKSIVRNIFDGNMLRRELPTTPPSNNL